MAHPETVPETNVEETDGPALAELFVHSRNGDHLSITRLGRPPLHRPSFRSPKTVEAGLTHGEAAKQLGIGGATAYRGSPF